MRIAVIGVGHVGLVTGLVFASKGLQVVCLEKQAGLRSDLQRGKSHIFEPGIEEMLQNVSKTGSLSFEPSEPGQLKGCEAVFICVDTPIGPAGINFDQLKETLNTTAKAIAESDQYVTVIIKSTVIPGTTLGLVKNTLEESSGKRCFRDFGLASNPEFLREGNGIDDFLNADRIIIGTEDLRSRETLDAIYRDWGCPLVHLNTTTAEFVKYYSNVLLSVLISFTNEMANVASVDERIDFKAVIDAVSGDKRLSPKLADGSRLRPDLLSYLIPGPGFGGSCLPKDLEAFAYYAQSIGSLPRMLNATMKTNDVQAQALLQLMERRIGPLDSKRVMVLGLTHKPNTNDIRESSSTRVIDLLIEKKTHLTLHDPIATEFGMDRYKDHKMVKVVADWKAELDESDIVILMTGWEIYRELATAEQASKLNGKVLVDTRYFYNASDFELSHYISF